MKKLSLDDLHLAIDEVCRIYDEDEVIVVGSVAVLGSNPLPPDPMGESFDIDLYPRYKPADKNLEVALEFGPDSDFRNERGWYIEGVGQWTTRTTPAGWQERLRPITTANGKIGWCLAPIDLAFNKIEAARDKDLGYIADLIKHKFVSYQELESVIKTSSPEPEIATRNLEMLRKVASRLKEEGISLTGQTPDSRSNR